MENGRLIAWRHENDEASAFAELRRGGRMTNYEKSPKVQMVERPTIPPVAIRISSFLRH
jgi:hypothetical protein